MTAANFDPASVTIERLQSRSPEAIRQSSVRYDFPYLPDFLDDVERRLSGAEEAYGRRYQREALRRSGLEIISPLSGETVISKESVAIRGKIFYRFLEAVEYYVASSRISHGYPLSALFVPKAAWMLRWQPTIRRRHLRLLALLPAQDCVELPGREVPAIVMGHQNFAHHLWNELSAFERFLTEPRPVPNPEILVSREPLGALEEIFPEIASWKITRMGGSEPPSASQPGKLFVNMGGYRISSTLRQRIVRHANAAATCETIRLIADIKRRNAPVFWLSVRTQRPTLVNQAELLCLVIVELLRIHTNCCILLDGFSLPQDWQRASEEAAEFYIASTRDSRQTINSIIDSALQISKPAASQLIANVGGLGILDSIALAQLVTGYFCHAGSVQHKVGWTANKPGIIHGNCKILSGDPASWHAERVEAGVRPRVMEKAMIEDLNPGLNPDENYCIPDCHAASRFVTNYFARCLALTTDSRYA